MAELRTKESGARICVGHTASGTGVTSVTRSGRQGDPHRGGSHAVSKMDHFLKKMRLRCS